MMNDDGRRRVAAAREFISKRLHEIQSYFTEPVKVTLIVRNPAAPDGARDRIRAPNERAGHRPRRSASGAGVMSDPRIAIALDWYVNKRTGLLSLNDNMAELLRMLDSTKPLDGDAVECPDCYDGGACLPGGCGAPGCQRCGKPCPTCNGTHEVSRAALSAMPKDGRALELADYDIQAGGGLTFDVELLKRRVELDAAIVVAAERLRDTWNRMVTGVPLRDAQADLRDAVDAKHAALNGDQPPSAERR